MHACTYAWASACWAALLLREVRCVPRACIPKERARSQQGAHAGLPCAAICSACTFFTLYTDGVCITKYGIMGAKPAAGVEVSCFASSGAWHA